ncbi:two-component system sensor histidine kinase NtrB [Paenibacillus turpanensis]|uniref:two-component system sensor histidine kinase NtrB n=1 Tax=Paenibacillus turpanensis TaxID=2689078 RepID=UPI00140A008B|nr:HAMP domain-containing sensor histidine kinase [Paenibacillus turpanensis]
MEVERWMNEFFQTMRSPIIQEWIHTAETDFPEIYDLGSVSANAKIYYELLSDLTQPVETHPQNSIVSTICQYHAARQTPISHLLHISYIWRKITFEYAYQFLKDKKVGLDEAQHFLRQLDERSEAIRCLIGQGYWDYASQILHDQERAIIRLHEDRLNLIGKVAASMAHELRNPLFAIEGLLKLLRNKLPSSSLESVEPYLGVMEEEFDALYRQIAGLLSFTKNSGIHEPFVTITGPLIVESVIQMVSAQLAVENIELVLDLDASVQVTVQKQAVLQVVTNLVVNSIDALREVEGDRHLCIRCFEDQEGQYLSVEDNGPGIPPPLASTVFTPFVTGKKNGSGLGLPVCKQIMEKNGGGITYRSEPGSTVFTLFFPKRGREQTVS